MDVEVARTFLEVVAGGNFGRAAERLNVTQSTVSMRIRALEAQLGRRLFVRNKAGAVLTAAGTQFHRYATMLVQVWEKARHQVAVPPGHTDVIAIGGQFSLWDRLLLRWLARMRADLPDIALRAEFGPAEMLTRFLVEGMLDIAVTYAPERRPGLVVEPLFADELVLVASRPEASGAQDRDYIYVDWGPEFQAAHNAAFAEFPGARLFVSVGSLALDYVLDNGGVGYFPRRLIRSHLDSGRLHAVPHAPTFAHPAYMAYAEVARRPALDQALDALRAIALRETRRGRAPRRRGTGMESTGPGEE